MPLVSIRVSLNITPCVPRFTLELAPAVALAPVSLTRHPVSVTGPVSPAALRAG